MIDDHGVSRKEQVLREGHATALRGMNWRACWRGEIHSTVRRPRLPVQDAALSKVAAGGYAVEGHAKIPIPQFLRRHSIKNRAQTVAFFIRALDLLGIGLNEFLLDVQAFGSELPRTNANLERAASGFAASRLQMDDDRISAGRFFQVHAKKGLAFILDRGT